MLIEERKERKRSKKIIYHWYNDQYIIHQWARLIIYYCDNLYVIGSNNHCQIFCIKYFSNY